MKKDNNHGNNKKRSNLSGALMASAEMDEFDDDGDRVVMPKTRAIANTAATRNTAIEMQVKPRVQASSLVSTDARPLPTKNGATDDANAKDLEVIRDQYFKKAPAKRIITKISDRNKVVFDWEAGDDTTQQDMKPLFDPNKQLDLCFGRGSLAGIHMDQMNKNSEYSKIVQQRGGGKLVEADLKRRRKAGGDEDEELTHWTRKPFDEMLERDWKIVCEDFNIAYKGTNPPHAIRFWRESGLSPQLLGVIDKLGYVNPTPIQV